MGILSQINGILFGRPGGNLPVKDIQKYDDILKSVLADEFGVKEIPIVTQMDFGHCDPMLVLPYGAEVEIDPLQKTIKLTESSVL